jgi:hypothetical protein
LIWIDIALPAGELSIRYPKCKCYISQVFAGWVSSRLLSYLTFPLTHPIYSQSLAIMGNGPSKRSQSRGQFGDFTVDSKASFTGQSINNYQSAPPPYTPTVTSPVTGTARQGTHFPLASRHTQLFTIPPEALRTNSTARAAYLRTPFRAESLEDALETLRQYDTIILMDDSSSMAGSLWKEVQCSSSSLSASG